MMAGFILSSLLLKRMLHSKEDVSLNTYTVSNARETALWTSQIHELQMALNMESYRLASVCTSFSGNEADCVV